MEDKKSDSPEKQFQQLDAHGLLKKSSLTGQSEIVNTIEDDKRLNPINRTYKLARTAQYASRLHQSSKRLLHQPKRSRLNFENKGHPHKNSSRNSSTFSEPDGSSKDTDARSEKKSRLKQAPQDPKLKFENLADRDSKAGHIRPTTQKSHGITQRSLFKPENAKSQRLRFKSNATPAENSTGSVDGTYSQSGNSKLNFDSTVGRRNLRFNKSPRVGSAKQNSPLPDRTHQRFRVVNTREWGTFKETVLPNTANKAFSQTGDSALRFDNASGGRKFRFNKIASAGNTKQDSPLQKRARQRFGVVNTRGSGAFKETFPLSNRTFSQTGDSALRFDNASGERKLRFNKAPGAGRTKQNAGSPLSKTTRQRFRLVNTREPGAFKEIVRPNTANKAFSQAGNSALRFDNASGRRKLIFNKNLSAGRIKQSEVRPTTLNSHTRFRLASVRNTSAMTGGEQPKSRLQFDSPSEKQSIKSQTVSEVKNISAKDNVSGGIRFTQKYTCYKATTEQWRFGGVEQQQRSKFIDREKRPSRLKFEEDRAERKARSDSVAGAKKLKTENSSEEQYRFSDLKKNIEKGGLFGSVLRHETDRTLDNLAQKSENQAVEGVNAERKLASKGARYGLRFGRQWRDEHSERVSRREVKRQNKQLLRDLKEQHYELTHGRPSPAAKRRQAMEGYRKQARARVEQKIGVEATAKMEKVLAFIAEKGAAIIRAAVAFVGAPLLGIVLAFLFIALLALAFVGGINNTAIAVLTSYTADNVTIEAASSYYTKLEAELDKEIKNISTAWEWQHIDQFHYDLDDIEHDPFQLMGYLSVKYPGFTFSDVKTELDYIFDQRYTLTTHQWYEWRGKSPHRYKYYHLDVTLRAKPMEPILRQELAKDTKNDLVSWYGVLMETKGAHQAYANPFDIDWSGNVSSLYGYRVDPIGEKELQQHRGVDIAMPTGTPIRAGLSGTVRYVGHDNIMGNYIILDADGVEHTMKYGHCDKVRVSVGDKVVAGETVIGTVGNSGQSTGPHLHVEILENGKYVNPIYSLNYKEKTT
ncbi:MAG: M23 family metallopeptidase [Candidatus Fimivivens sp.]|nr:M23 family metallopeptidase [Candidatus Fimivivens sp.]